MASKLTGIKIFTLTDEEIEFSNRLDEFHKNDPIPDDLTLMDKWAQKYFDNPEDIKHLKSMISKYCESFCHDIHLKHLSRKNLQAAAIVTYERCKTMITLLKAERESYEVDKELFLGLYSFDDPKIEAIDKKIVEIDKYVELHQKRIDEPGLDFVKIPPKANFHRLHADVGNMLTALKNGSAELNNPIVNRLIDLALGKKTVSA